MERAKQQEILKEIVTELSQYELYQILCHQHREGEPFPSEKVLHEIIEILRSTLFPGFFGNSTVNHNTMDYHIGVSVERLMGLLTEQIMAGLCFNCPKENRQPLEEVRKAANEKATAFISFLPQLRKLLANDVMAAYNGDPAATSYGEVIFCYPAIRAISNYRIAHQLLLLEVPLIPRMIAEMAHSETGIDIHPAATIGEYFTIDHGTGVVIGATAIIGNNVKIYQGVTLGAKSFPLDEMGVPIKGIARHPIIQDDVIIYSNATILGRITIGKGASIGGNIWVTEDVMPYSKVVQGRQGKE